MDKPNVESKFKFLGYQVNNISLITNPTFQNVNPIDIDFNITVGTSMNVEERKVQVTLGTVVFPDANKKNYPFSLEITLTGLFQSEENLAIEALEHFGEINGTAALFPFLRSTIAGVCVNANFPAIMFPLINVFNFIEEQKKNKLIQDNQASTTP